MAVLVEKRRRQPESGAPLLALNPRESDVAWCPSAGEDAGRYFTGFWTGRRGWGYDIVWWSVPSSVDAQRDGLAKGLKIAFIVVALAAAAGIPFFWGKDPGAVALADDVKGAWQCTECAHRFDLTAREEQSAIERTGGEPIHCAGCAKKAAWRLMACMRCGTLFFPPDVPEQSGRCPKCPPELQPRPEEPSAEPGAEPIEPDGPQKRVRPKSV